MNWILKVLAGLFLTNRVPDAWREVFESLRKRTTLCKEGEKWNIQEGESVLAQLTLQGDEITITKARQISTFSLSKIQGFYGTKQWVEWLIIETAPQ